MDTDRLVHFQIHVHGSWWSAASHSPRHPPRRRPQRQNANAASSPPRSSPTRTTPTLASSTKAACSCNSARSSKVRSTPPRLPSPSLTCTCRPRHAPRPSLVVHWPTTPYIAPDQRRARGPYGAARRAGYRVGRDAGAHGGCAETAYTCRPRGEGKRCVSCASVWQTRGAYFGARVDGDHRTAYSRAARPHRCIQNMTRDVGMKSWYFTLVNAWLGVEDTVRGNNLMNDTIMSRTDIRPSFRGV